MEAPHSTTDVDLYHLELAERYGVKLPRRNFGPKDGQSGTFPGHDWSYVGRAGRMDGREKGRIFPEQSRA